jgi:hypothetical protein
MSDATKSEDVNITISTGNVNNAATTASTTASDSGTTSSSNNPRPLSVSPPAVVAADPAASSKVAEGAHTTNATAPNATTEAAAAVSAAPNATKGTVAQTISNGAAVSTGAASGTTASANHPQVNAAAAAARRTSMQPKFIPTWHKNKEDLPIRRNMITQIVHLLQKRKPNAPPEWLKKIPDMARRLEDSLYRSAQSKIIYQDMSTLKTRLHGVAQSYQRNRTNNQVSGHQSQHHVHLSSEHRAHGPGGNMLPNHSRDPRLSGSGGSGGVPGVTAPRQGNTNKVMTEEEKKLMAKQKQQVLRQQQQRLLLLRHASKCKYGTAEIPQTCPATKHCKEMKTLWLHITRCKDQRCQRAHCVS